MTTLAPTRGRCDDRRVRRTVLVVDDHAEFRDSARALGFIAKHDLSGPALTRFVG